MKNNSHQVSFKHAFEGLFYALRTQPNFKIHLALSALAILAGIYLKISYLEMVAIIMMIGVGLAAEMINTTVEAVTDLVTNEWRKEAKIAKDVAAGMMLLVSFGALAVAGLILLPHFFARFF